MTKFTAIAAALIATAGASAAHAQLVAPVTGAVGATANARIDAQPGLDQAQRSATRLGRTAERNAAKAATRAENTLTTAERVAEKTKARAERQAAMAQRQLEKAADKAEAAVPAVDVAASGEAGATVDSQPED